MARMSVLNTLSIFFSVRR